MTNTVIRRSVSIFGCLLIVPLAVSGCGGWEEHVCGDGSYPAAQIAGPGSYCESNGTEPSSGFIRYPKGQVPEMIGDKWDLYWSDHYLDRDGRVFVPAGTEETVEPTH